MKFKENHKFAIERLKCLYSKENKGRIYAKMNVPNKALMEYRKDTTDGPVPYPDPLKRIKFWNDYLCAHTKLEDDSIPCAYMSEFDEGLYGALFGGKITFLNDTSWGWVSSMIAPFVDDIKEIRYPENVSENPWFKAYLDQMEIFRKHSGDNFGISHFIVIDSINFLVELRGATNAYYDMIDYPDEVNRVIEIAKRINFLIHDKYFECIGTSEGGTFSNLGQWIPGRIISESLDPFHLMSVDTFEEWGRSPAEDMFSRYDGGIVHLHSNGHHLIKAVSTLKGLKCIALLDEPFNPPVYLKLLELDKLRTNIPLHVSMPFAVFVERLKKRSLPGNVFYEVLDVPDIYTANKTMEEVRKYEFL